MPHCPRGIYPYHAWHGIRQACMWRDDGTRSAVKQSYRRVTVLVHGIPSLLSFLSPSCRATGAGMEGRGGTWEVVPARPCSCSCSVLVNLLFHVIGGAILYYKLYYTTCKKRKYQTREQKMTVLFDEYKFILIIYTGFSCNLTMGVFHMLRWGAIVYTPCA